MKPNLFFRIVLAFLLAVAFVGIMTNIKRALQDSVLGLNYGPDEPLGIVGFMGSLLLVVFIIILVIDLLRGRVVSKTAYIVGVTIGVISAVMFSYLVYGLVQDASGVFCTALFGLQASCTDAPLMILMYIIFNPFVLVILGLAALSGTLTQLRARKQASPRGGE